MASTSLIGIVLAFSAPRSVRARLSTEIAQNPETTVEAIMKPEVYALSPEAPVLQAGGSPVGFPADGEIRRYLSAAHPSSTSIYSDEDLEQALSDLAGLNVMKPATREAITINAGTSITDAVAVLAGSTAEESSGPGWGGWPCHRHCGALNQQSPGQGWASCAPGRSPCSYKGAKSV